MACAVNLQNLLYLLAFKYIASGKIDHAGIPDDPFVESERRQIIFGRAIGLPTFFVHRETPNTFLKGIIRKTGAVRSSRRYSGYVRVCHQEYCKALLEILKQDAADLIEMLDLKETVIDLESRITDPDHYAASGKITNAILASLGSRSPMSVAPDRFNPAAEEYYRTGLRSRHVAESFNLLKRALQQTEQNNLTASAEIRHALGSVNPENHPDYFLDSIQRELAQAQSTPDRLEQLVGLILIYVAQAENQYKNYRTIFNGGDIPLHESSVY